MVAPGVKVNHLLLDGISTRRRMQMASLLYPFVQLFRPSSLLHFRPAVDCPVHPWRKRRLVWTPLVLAWLLPEMEEGELAWTSSVLGGQGGKPHTPVPREEDGGSEMQPCVKRIAESALPGSVACSVHYLMLPAEKAPQSKQGGLSVKFKPRLRREYPQERGVPRRRLCQPTLSRKPTRSQWKSAWLILSQQPGGRLSCWHP